MRGMRVTLQLPRTVRPLCSRCTVQVANLSYGHVSSDRTARLWGHEQIRYDWVENSSPKSAGH